MTQENKQLLLKDLCARLPYGVKVRVTDALNGVEYDSVVYAIHPNSAAAETYDDEHGLVGWPSLMFASFKPYLRPMSSMTEEEVEEEDHTIMKFRMGLALEAPDGMYML